jgi:D-sedoheptulose 7-phosphate isomerase
LNKNARAVQDSFDEYPRDRHFAVKNSFLKLLGRAQEVGRLLASTLQARHKVLVFGNGESATQASQFAGELLARFSKMPRVPVPALALASDPGIVTCIANDFGSGALFERQIEALAEPGDIALALTTSGTSENVLRGLSMARRKRASTVALTGKSGLAGGKVDYLLDVPSRSTHHIQEVHIMFLHLWCVHIDRMFCSHRPKSPA